MSTAAVVARREFLKTGGALIIGFNLAGVSAQEAAAVVTRPLVAGPPDQQLIDTWIAIHADNTATVFIGFVELGQGTSTALLQIAADELDLDMSQYFGQARHARDSESGRHRRQRRSTGWAPDSGGGG